MNNVIRKCVDELNKEAPRIDYIRGMLESLLVMNAPAPYGVMMDRAYTEAVSPTIRSTEVVELSDEDQSVLKAYEKGPIGKIST